MNGLGQLYVTTRDGWRELTRTASLTPEEEESALGEASSGNWPSPEQAVRATLEYAAAHVPYYAEVARQLGEDRTDLSKWPVLTKDIMRREGSRLHVNDLQDWDAKENTSGGSTGKPVRFWHDRRFRERANAARRFYTEELLGIGENVSQIILWGSERDILDHQEGPSWADQLRDWLRLKMGLKTTHLNAFRMSEQDVDRYIRTIQYEKPEVIHAYAGSLFQLARRALDSEQKLPSPKRIYTTAETLQPFMRECIEEAFGIPVQDFYGSREVGPIAGQDPDGHMITFDFFNVVEVVDDEGRPVQPGRTGKILVTTLHNSVMPFIRYEIGDMAVKGEPRQVAGRTFGTLQRVIGRITDHFVTPEDALVHGEYFTHLFYFQDWVDEFQVNQHASDRLEVLYKPLLEPLPGALASIEEKIHAVMGPHCNIEWREVNEVPRTREGKLLFTRCLIPEEQLPKARIPEAAPAGQAARAHP